MKKFSKSLAVVMALALTVSSVSPATADAASKKPAWKASTAKVAIGKKYTFKVKNLPSKGKVTFKSNKSSVLKITSKTKTSATVKGMKAGKAVLKAIVKDKKGKTVKVLSKKVTVAKNKNTTPTPTSTTNPQPTTSATVEPTPQATKEPSKEVEKVTVTAIGRTWVEVSFPQAVDSSAIADNFKITTTESDIAATVNSAHWYTGNKTVKLNVTGLQYDKNYTITFSGLKSAGIDYNVEPLAFRSSAIQEAWTLQIVPEREKLTADGVDNMKITFNLVDSATGEVAQAADEVVLELSTTYGAFQTKDLVLKNGTGIAVLRSDFFPVPTKSKIHVEVKETSAEYAFLKGTVSADKVIEMEAANYSTSGEARLDSANSAQADRITLLFDKPVTVASFAEFNKATKSYKTEWVAAKEIGWTPNEDDPNIVKKGNELGYVRQKMINTKKSSVKFTVTQEIGGKTVQYPVVGLNTVQGNPNALELVLHEAKPLNDNAKVYISYENEKASNLKKVEFSLLDITPPSFISATSEGMKRVALKFSEPIPELVNGKKKVNDVFNVEVGSHYKFKQDGTIFGTFDPATLEDTRNTVILTLDKNEEGKQQYFQERENDNRDDYPYGIAITNLVDYAGTNSKDKENVIEANPNTTFKVTGDKRKPEATVTVESPEQFRINFNCPVTFDLKGKKALANVFQEAFQVKGDRDEYVNVFVNENGKYVVDKKAKILGDKTVVPNIPEDSVFFNVTSICNGKKVANGQPANEFVVELKQDWTTVYKTSKNTKNYYNDDFQFKFAEQTILNDDNGWKNDAIKLDLNYAGSPLEKDDKTSPIILDIHETSDKEFFTAVMDEPIQYNNSESVGSVKSTNTYSETLQKLSDVTVKVEGTNPAGKPYTFNGIFRGYDIETDTRKTDTMLKLEIKDSTGKTLQDLVDEGYGSDWTLSLQYPYDDVLNTTSTVSKVFTVEPSEENVFQILNVVGVAGAASDVVTVTFTKGVATNGAAVQPNSWTLNGTKLASAVINVDKNSGTDATGYRTITITLPAGTLTANRKTILDVDQTITSALGIALTGEHQIEFLPTAQK